MCQALWEGSQVEGWQCMSSHWALPLIWTVHVSSVLRGPWGESNWGSGRPSLDQRDCMFLECPPTIHMSGWKDGLRLIS